MTTLSSQSSSTTSSTFKERFSDFANLFKAFIGTNYLAVPYAFSLAGYLPASFLLFFVAFITAHSCNLIVIDKYLCVRAIRRKLDALIDCAPNPEHNSQHQQQQEQKEVQEVVGSSVEEGMRACTAAAKTRSLIAKLHGTRHVLASRAHSLALWHLGRIVWGRRGQLFIMASLFTLQYVFSAVYFIFLGSTLDSLIDSPLFSRNKSLPPSSHSTSTHSSSTHSNTTLSPPHYAVTTRVWTILAPLPILTALALLKSVRKLGPISAASNMLIWAGFLIALGIMCVRFDAVHPGVVAAVPHGLTAAVTFGVFCGGFEGIGMIISIQSSMTGNQRNFSRYLYAAIFLVSLILGTFGFVGYFRFGPRVQQIILLSLPGAFTDSASGRGGAAAASGGGAYEANLLIFLLNALLVLAVLGTYPLQLFPSIEIVEALIFSSTSASTRRYNNDVIGEEQHTPLLHSASSCSAATAFAASSASFDDEEDADRAHLRKPARLDATAVSFEDSGVIPTNSLDYQTLPFTSSSSSTTSSSAMLVGVEDAPSWRRRAEATLEQFDWLFELEREQEGGGGGEAQSRQSRHTRETSSRRRLCLRNALRVVLVLIQAGLAVLMRNHYALSISLIGNLGGNLLGFVLPALLHFKLTASSSVCRPASGSALISSSGAVKWGRVRDLALITFGLAAATINTSITLIQLFRPDLLK